MGRLVVDGLVGWLVGWLVGGKFVGLRGRQMSSNAPMLGTGSRSGFQNSPVRRRGCSTLVRIDYLGYARDAPVERLIEPGEREKDDGSAIGSMRFIATRASY